MFCGPEKTRSAQTVSRSFRKTSASAPVLPNGEKVRHIRNSHVKSPNKAGAAGVFGIKLSEYAKNEVNEDEFFIPPDEPAAVRGPAG